MEETLVELHELSKSYVGLDRPAVDKLSLTLRRGDIFGFVGPNGAGKTGLYGFSIIAVVFSFTFFLGVLIDTQMQVIVAGLALCLIMTVLGVFKATSFLSLYAYMNLDILRSIFASSQVPIFEILVFMLLCAALFTASWWRFSKKTI